MSFSESLSSKANEALVVFRGQSRVGDELAAIETLIFLGLEKYNEVRSMPGGDDTAERMLNYVRTDQGRREARIPSVL